MDSQSVATFIANVVPWPQGDAPGVINVHWNRPSGHWTGRATRTVPEFQGLVKWLKNNPESAKDIYYCLSLQGQCGSAAGHLYLAERSAEAALALKAVWLDVDVGEKKAKEKKGYATLEDAKAAIEEFRSFAKLPDCSAIVHSGGGLHVYWISSAVLDISDWEPYALGLRNLAEHHGLRCDLGVTIDSARILRVPGTWNKKTDERRPVSLEHLGQAHDFPTALGHIRVQPKPKVKILNVLNGDKFDEPPDPIFAALGGDQNLEVEVTKLEGLKWDGIFGHRGCPFFIDSKKSGGAGVDQGLWMLTGLACTFLEDGRELFHKLSKGHKDYNVADCDKMFDRKDQDREEGKRWPHCGTFAKYGAQQCNNCIHFGKITSPVSLAGEAEELSDPPPDPSVKPPDPPPGPPIAETAASEVIKLFPTWCGYDTRGYLHSMKYSAVTKKWVPDEVLLYCRLSDPWLETKDRTTHFTASVGGQPPVEVSYRFESLANPQAFAMCLTKQTVAIGDLTKTVKAMKYFTDMLAKNPTVDTIAYGWSDDGFAYDGKLYTSRGEIPRAGAADKKLLKDYTVVGSAAPWYRALRTITDQHRPALEAIVATAFAAPLMHLAGHDGATLAAIGNGATNKSSASNVALAVWGHPQNTKRAPSSSVVSMFTIASQLRHLPILWDDVRDYHLDKVSQVTNEITEGNQGNKAFTDGTLRDTGSWATMIVVVSNSSLMEYLIKQSTTDSAQVHRVFEIRVEDPAPDCPGRMDEWEATPIFALLKSNYGAVGAKYAAFLGKDKVGIQAMVRDELRRFGKDMVHESPERFWLDTCACILVGATLANMQGATFNLAELRAFLEGEYLQLRARVFGESLVGGSKENTDKILTLFFKEHGENMLHIRKPPDPGRYSKAEVLHGPRYDDRPVHILWTVMKQECRISKPAFTKFLRELKYDPVAVERGLKKHYGAKITAGYNLAAGTDFISAGRERVIVLNVPEDWHQQYAYNVTPGIEDDKGTDDKAAEVDKATVGNGEL